MRKCVSTSCQTVNLGQKSAEGQKNGKNYNSKYKTNIQSPSRKVIAEIVYLGIHIIFLEIGIVVTNLLHKHQAALCDIYDTK